MRESLGVRAAVPEPDEVPEPTSFSAPLPRAGAETLRPASEIPGSSGVVDSAALAPLPLAEPFVKQVRSLKRSERLPLGPSESAQASSPRSELSTLPELAGVATSDTHRTVHSFKKSERIPLGQVTPPAGDSSLPHHRHSPDEIARIKRAESIAARNVGGGRVSQDASWWIVVPGYVAAVTAGVGYYHYEFGMQLTGGLLAVALIIAGAIFITKPYSRHHASFIGMIALLVGVFAALHFFPQLRYGT